MQKKKSLSIFLLFLLFSSGITVITASSATVFTDGFETGDFSQWTGTVGSPKPTIVTSPVHHGLYAAQAVNNGSQIYKNMTTTDEVYCRMYWRYSGSLSSGEKIMIMWLSSLYSNFMGVYLTNDGGTYKWAIRDMKNWTDYYYSSQQLPSAGTWYCVEARAKANVDGVMALYIDGHELTDITLTGFNDSVGVTSVRLFGEDGSSGITQVADCVVVANSYIGPESTISGVVFDDANENGARDAGEAGVAGVTVTFDNADQLVTPADGSYTFSGVLQGEHTVEATVPAGYVATTLTIVDISVSPGNEYVVNFGIKADTNSPITSHNYDGFWHSHDFDITLSATDDLTGVSETFYRVNGGLTRNVTANGQPRIDSEGANNTLEYWSLDNAGNEELPHKLLTEIKLDKTAPTGSIVINNGAEYTNSTSVLLNLTAIDAMSGVSQVRFSNDGSWDTEQWENPSVLANWTLISGNGDKTVYYQIKDNAENFETYSDAIVLDVVSPSGSITINNGDTCTTLSSVILFLTYSDTTGSGVLQVRYSNDANSWSSWESASATKTWDLASGDGTKTVYFQIKDNAGNVATYTDTILLDTTAPTGSIIINGGDLYTTSNTVTISFTAADATSGVYKIRLSNDGIWDTEQWETPSATKSWALLSTEGARTVYYQIKDNAGLSSTTYTDTIILDTSLPQGSIQINSGAGYTNTTEVNLALSASDIISGVSQMRFSNDNITWSTWEPYASSKSLILQNGDGVKSVTVQYRDNAGLISSYSSSIILDTIVPVANAGQGQTVNQGNSVTFDASSSTDNIGIASYVWDFADGAHDSGKTTTHSYSTAGTYVAKLIVQDPAGNTATSTVTIVVQAPQPTPSPSPTPQPSPSPTATPTPNPSPSPSPASTPTPTPPPQPTPTSTPQPPEERPLLLYALVVAVIFAIIGTAGFWFRRRR